MANETKPRMVRAKFDIHIKAFKRPGIPEGFEHRTGYMVGGYLGVDRRDEAGAADRWVVTDLWSGCRVGEGYKNFRTRREAIEMCVAILPVYEAHDRESDEFMPALKLALGERAKSKRGVK